MGHQPAARAPATRYHLLMKPTVSGTPISPSPATTMAAIVSGIRLPRPRIALMSVAPTRSATAPTTMNSAPFIRA